MDELGFDADPALVREILAVRPPGTREGGFTDSELAELRRRDELHKRLEPALVLLDQSPAELGGHYFDQSVGEMLLVINVPKGEASAKLSAVKALLPADAPVEYHTSDYTRAQLEELRDELFFGLPSDPAKTAYVDPKLQQVVLTVAAENLAAAERLRAGRSAAVVQVGAPVVGAACSLRESCELPWRGGTYLSGCTWGFNARPTIASSTRYVLSAGHCANLGDDLVHDGSIVNTAIGVDRNTFDLGSPISESMRAPLKTDSGARNLVYISSVNTGYAITSKAGTSTQTAGVGIAMSGRSSLYVSGTIQAADLLAEVCRGSECYVTSLWRATFNVKPGDSGAPVISKTLPKAYGIMYGTALGGDNRGLYSPIDRVLADMWARLCLDAACN